MKQFAQQILLASTLYLGCLAGINSAQAQITSDGTVPTSVSQSGNVFEITGGGQAGANLFHSFRQFSLPTGNTAFFNNNVSIANIISRVTGGSISNIDGLIKANGGANLILINPSGIYFGPNARLDIGGSFLGSTANSVTFADGTEFSATNPQNPLLTVSVPVGLQMGQNSGAIQVQGTGHNLSLEAPIFSPLTRGSVTGLKVKQGKTLALVGGDLNLEGGTLTAEGGRIELGSAAEGLIRFSSTSPGWTFGYEGVSVFKDINLSQKALADVSGIISGSIQVQGQRVSVSDGSTILLQNQGNQASGALHLKASESLEVIGTTTDGGLSSALLTETIGNGRGGDINIATQQLIVRDGGIIISDSFSEATAGNITIDASESLQIIGFAPINPSRFSIISAQTFGAGDAGDITVSTKTFTAVNGGNLASVTGGIWGTGSGGDVIVNASESVELTGVVPEIFTPSQVTAGTGGPGEAGNVTINTQRLVLRDGGRIDASTTATGNAGSVTINASESLEVSGTVPGSRNPSLVISSANILDPTLQELLQLPPVPSGNSGNVTINTGQLIVTDGAQVTVRNDGLGDAGTLEVNANSIFLNNQGGITALTRDGNGGSINLQVRNALQMGGLSQISSDNFGGGDSGDLTIETGKLSISDGAFISASTFGEGRGSNVAIGATDSVEITGTGFEEFQETFQASALLGTLLPTDRGTGIFMGTAGTGASGHLTIKTPSLLLNDGAVIFSPTFTEGIGGNITINASESVELSGSAVQVGTSPNSTGAAGKIEIETGKLILRDGATIINATFGDGAGGNLEISALESLELRNTPAGALLLTGIYANTTLGSGAGGDIRIDTGKLSIQDGVIGSNTGASLPTGVIPFGGPGGNIIVNATESIELAGIQPDTRFPSGLGTTSFSQSSSGDVTISTKKLTVSEGADVSTAALGAGQGGTLTINASESIELIGTTVGDLTLGGLSASSGRANLPELEATGASGDIKVTTKNLIVRDGASIDVQSLGSGDAGNLEVVADSILLDNQGTISAASSSGEGGNINLQVNSLLMRHNSQISATAGGTGNGGNITLTGSNSADFVVLLEGSQISANAFQGRGGNVQIDTKALFVCGDCRISASSELGVEGLVTINRLQPNTELQVIDVPQEVAESEEVVALACSTTEAEERSEFIITGRGGLPPRPTEPLSSDNLVNFDSSSRSESSSVSENLTEETDATKLPAPARGWYVNSQGVLILTAQAPSALPYSSSLTTPKCHGN